MCSVWQERATQSERAQETYRGGLLSTDKHRKVPRLGRETPEGSGGGSCTQSVGGGESAHTPSNSAVSQNKAQAYLHEHRSIQHLTRQN